MGLYTVNLVQISNVDAPCLAHSFTPQFFNPTDADCEWEKIALLGFLSKGLHRLLLGPSDARLLAVFIIPKSYTRPLTWSKDDVDEYLNGVCNT